MITCALDMESQSGYRSTLIDQPTGCHWERTRLLNNEDMNQHLGIARRFIP
jgi:hypothetical protein